MDAVEPPIRPVKEVVREHIEATLAEHRGKVSLQRIALELGICHTTLFRWKKEWASGETLVGDRR